MADVLTDLFRSLMFFLDGIVYGFIPTLYGLISYIAQVDIFSSDPNIQILMNQIYALLAIFMLFKLSFSILQYVINPDSLTDDSKGIGKIVSHALIVIILLVTVPYIFNIAYKLQAAIVQSNVIGQLLLGSSFGTPQDQGSVGQILQEFFDLPDPNPTNASSEEQIASSEVANKLETNATDLQFLIFGAFYSINTNKLTECEGTPIIGSNEMAAERECIDRLANEFDTDDDLANNNANLANYFRTEDDDTRQFKELGDILNWRIDNEYVVNYLPFISTVAGIYLIFLLITICIDIAMRAIKLCFLQMIAPISIVSYVDPKESSKDSKLGRWASEVGRTYASLFIRLATVFLVIRFVSIIASSVFEREFLSDIGEYKMWVFVFLILGAFVFAKQVPKLLENLLNVKSSGEFSLNPIKNIKENVADTALGKGVSRTGRLGAGITGGIAGAVTGAGAGRLLAGVWNGVRGKSVKDVLSTTASGNRKLRLAKAENSTFWGRRGAQLSSLFGTQGSAGRIEQEKFEVDHQIEERNNEIKQYNDQIRDYQRVTSSTKAMEDRAESQIKNGRAGHYSTRYKQYESDISTLKESRQAMLNRGIDVSDQRIIDLNNRIASEERNMNSWLNDAKHDYGNDVLNGTINDANYTNSYTDYQSGMESLGRANEVSADSRTRHGQSTNIKNDVNDLQRTVSDLQTQISELEQYKNENIRDRERVANANLKAVGGESGGRRARH